MTVTVPSVVVSGLEFTHIYGLQVVTCTMPNDRTKQCKRTSDSGLSFWDSFYRDLDELKQAYEHELTDQGVKPDGWEDHPETGVSIIDRKWYPSEAAEIKWEWLDGTAEVGEAGTTDADGNGQHQNGE